ncbi:DUF5643 domain-containing protein [Rossellomorea vietnamensis]|uniref:DUF5643 domain-containing protein n=1 Tax=Rossellomorea vietnamensis TaxID=218284 RepID=A0ACD4CBY0_9BACI|nr:DUF4179 domain-containing protein [Rossellomorea vietnamensis]UXH46184.1 DUF5643 domain-containing protein [Rossellomorea vietnamensis]
MAKLETGPVPVSRNYEREMESIIARFEEEKHSFYALARVYTNHHQEMEDLFYRSLIRLEGEGRKRKKAHSAAATKVFLEECQKVSEPSLSSDDDPFHPFHHLGAAEKEAVALVYMKGCDQDDAARILDIPIDEVKSRLFRGIRKLRETMGNGPEVEGCHEYQKHYLDYLGRTMDRPEKVDFEIHIYHCTGCQEDLASFQEVTLALAQLAEETHLPPDVMERVRKRLDQREAQRQKRSKKRKSILLSFAGLFVLLIVTGFITGGFASLYYSYTEDDEQLRAILQHNLGERLDLESESDGVKVTIKSVVADDVQTLVFYEVEDMKGRNRYMMNPYEGVIIENEYDVMKRDEQSSFYSPPRDQENLHNDKKNVYRGTISLQPVSVDEGTIKLQIVRLMQLNEDPSTGEWIGGGEMRFAEGGWSFEIPFEKQTSRVHKLDKKMEVAGIPVRLDQMTIAPTATVLEYSFQEQEKEGRIDMMTFESIEAKDKKWKADQFGGMMYGGASDNEGWNSFKTAFDTLYFDDPKDVTIRFGAAHLFVKDQKVIELDVNKELPDTIEYLGNTITIDDIKIGSPTQVTLTHDLPKDREYENVNYLYYRTAEEEEDYYSIGVSGGDGILMDKDGKKYEPGSYEYEKLDQPRYFETEQTIDFYNDGSSDDVVPTELVIDGYSTTKYLDDSVKVKLD